MISSAEPGSAILSPSENGAAVCMNRKLQNNFLPGELSGSQKDPDFYRTEPGGARVSMVLAEAGRAPLRPQLRSIKRNEGIRTIRHQSGDLLADLERAINFGGTELFRRDSVPLALARLHPESRTVIAWRTFRLPRPHRIGDGVEARQLHFVGRSRRRRVTDKIYTYRR